MLTQRTPTQPLSKTTITWLNDACEALERDLFSPEGNERRMAALTKKGKPSLWDTFFFTVHDRDLCYFRDQGGKFSG